MLLCFRSRDYNILRNDIWIDPDMVVAISSTERDYDDLWFISMRDGTKIILEELNSKRQRSFDKLVADINEVRAYNEQRPTTKNQMST